MKDTLLLVALLCAIPFLVACPSLGNKVDAVALFEPAQLAWPEIEKDYERGIADGLGDGDLVAVAADALLAEAPRMREALKSKSRDELRLVPWPTMKPWVQRGIADGLADGDIGPGVTQSLNEQLLNFDQIMTKLRGTD